MDISFARIVNVQLGSILSDNVKITHNEVIRNMKAKCCRSLSGLRNTEEILSLAPNKEQFRTTLRAVKLWAKSLYCFKNNQSQLMQSLKLDGFDISRNN